MTLQRFLVLSTLLIALSCGSSSNENKGVTTGETDKNSCLEKFAMEPCNIFTLEEISKFVGQDVDQINKVEPRKSKRSMMMFCTFLWDSGRTEMIETAIGEIESELNDLLSVGGFQVNNQDKTGQSNAEWFASRNKPLTAEQIEQYDNAYKEKIKESDKVTEEQGGSIAKLLAAARIEKIEGIGDGAVMETLGKQSQISLKTLHGHLSFTVSVNVSKDRSDNLALAKKVAEQVISKCN